MYGTIISIAIGFVGGIMFFGAYPEQAQAINDAVQPTIEDIANKLKDALVDFTKTEILK